MSTHSRAGILSRLAHRHRPVPNPGHLGGYDGELVQDKPGSEEADLTLTWRDGNGAPAETRLERAVTAAAAAIDPDEEWYGYAGTTRFDNPPQHARPYVGPSPAVLDVRADLDDLPLFRASVHAQMVRQESARGRRYPAGSWRSRYARIWHERTRPVDVPVPDFQLHRWDGIADHIVADALDAVEAEWAQREPEQDETGNEVAA